MAPIPRAEMGDVWPSVEPGRERRDYGSAVLSPSAACEVRSFQTLTVTYTVGRFGLDDTGAIRIAFRWVHDCGDLQTSDPEAMNYVTATSSNGAPLRLYVEPYGFRPWSLALRVTVAGGFMREGDTITVVFGDRSGGSPGMRMQTIAEAAWELKVSVDACATGNFNELDDQLHVPVTAGPPQVWRLIAPGRRRPGERFSLGIRVEDIWGNPADPDLTTLQLKAEHKVEGLTDTVSFAKAARTIRIEDLSFAGEATFCIDLLGPQGQHLARSNPVVILQGDHAGYWGDLHGQSGETVGIGTIEEYLEFARDLAFLDVSGHQANDFQITNAFWDKINATTAEMNVSGEFVVFPGYEWSGNTPVGGDHNVFFRHEGRQIRRSSHAMLPDRSDLDTDANTLDVLFDNLQGEDCVLYAHVGGRPADVAFAHDPVLKTAVEVHSNWGTFEWILTDSLALGHRVGVVANSDGHKGRPGAGPPGATEFGAYGGLTCFLAPDLTRDAIFECMRRRHHYGTSGSRMDVDIHARFSTPAKLFTRDPRHQDVTPELASQAMMGDIVHTDDKEISLDLRIAAASPIERIDISDGSAHLQTLRCYDVEDLGNRVRVLWQGAEYRGRGRNTHWHGEIAVIGASIDRMQPINQWNPERRLEMIDRSRVVFDAVTSGNFAGIDLKLDDVATLTVSTNLVSGKVQLADLGIEDEVFDAGGLERRIRIRRLPDELDRCDLQHTVAVPVGEQSAVWIRVTTLDGHQAWSSPIYVSRG